jgi:hypothetical protein
MIHRESLAIKVLCPKLNEVMNTVIRSVNYIDSSTEKQNFAELCEEMEEQYQSLLFYCNSR